MTDRENTIEIIDSFHNDLKIAKERLYDKCGFDITNPSVNIESVEYGACLFHLNGKKIIHRVSKITPTKSGQFVTIWQRNQDGITEPFHIQDDFDFIVITVKSKDNFGQFFFPKTVLAAKGIVSTNAKTGKRGIRVYSPWDIVVSKQAVKTQNWQTSYFLKITDDSSTDLLLAENLLMNKI
ncbi:MepB family protein [Flavobacterium degerlachei]|jgi:hypothetical protein|uniref:MepB protein n=1 Tax=Flavobacterium degerlachei TaxID=229203 RepID=A0A1H2WYQ6_9FLAO|nr:MepB family protein [Flavobacterium degerlachei]SDW85803.1 hypothetical protein SAMN05444338_10597 [Flavobacterium degerlachei]